MIDLFLLILVVAFVGGLWYFYQKKQKETVQPPVQIEPVLPDPADQVPDEPEVLLGDVMVMKAVEVQAEPAIAQEPAVEVASVVKAPTKKVAAKKTAPAKKIAAKSVPAKKTAKKRTTK